MRIWACYASLKSIRFQSPALQGAAWAAFLAQPTRAGLLWRGLLPSAARYDFGILRAGECRGLAWRATNGSEHSYTVFLIHGSSRILRSPQPSLPRTWARVTQLSLSRVGWRRQYAPAAH